MPISTAPYAALRMEVLQRSRSKLDKAAAYRLRVQLCVMKTQNAQAVDIALECLGLFGIEMLPHPTSQQVQNEYEEVWKNLNGRSIESLIELPRMSDPEMQVAMSVLSTLSAPAMNTDTNLFRLLVCHMVNVSIEYGITAAPTHGYAWFGVILGPVFQSLRNLIWSVGLRAELFASVTAWAASGKGSQGTVSSSDGRHLCDSVDWAISHPCWQD